MKTVKELSTLKEDALEDRMRELNKELMKLKSQVASGTIPKNPGRIKVVRKNIARIHTIKTWRAKQRNE